MKAAVFTVRNLSGVAANDEFEQLLTEAIRLEIENAGYAVVDGWEPLLDMGEKAPVHGPRSAALARGVGATLALSATSALGAIAGRKLLGRIPLHRLHQFSGIFFLVLAAFALSKVFGY